MFDLVPPIYHHYPNLNESDVLYLCNYCHNQLDKTKTYFLSKYPNWHKHVPKKIMYNSKMQEEQKNNLYNKAIKDITRQHEKQYQFKQKIYQLFNSTPNIIDTECLKSLTKLTDSSNSCKFRIPTAESHHKHFFC